MKLIICFILLSCYYINYVAGCDPVEVSFELCKLDPVCTYQMYIDINGEDDLTTFQFLHNRILYNVTYRLFIENLLCTPNVTITDPNAITIWIHYMSQYSYCPHTNEYYDNYIKKCICRPGKDCHHEKPRHALFHFDADHYVSWLVLFLFSIQFILFYVYTRKSIVLKDAETTSIPSVISPSSRKTTANKKTNRQ